MPTKRRKESALDLYHVVVRGINHEKIFNQKREKIYFEKIILEHNKNVEIYAFCLMSNHAHFIIRAKIQELSCFMARILAEYASYYNYKHHRNGHVFQNRFTSECIEDESYFWNCVRYIHMNPVKAGMIKNPVKYKFSSMSEYFTGINVIIHKKAITLLQKNFGKYEVFEEFHGLKQEKLFFDVKDEILMQQEEIALYIAEKMHAEKKLILLSQVFEEKELREEYVLLLQNDLKVTKKKAKELCVAIKNKVEYNE